MQTQYQVGQLRKAVVAHVGYEYHDPHSQTVPLIPDSWTCSCSLLGLCQMQGAMGPWEPHPHNPI